MKSQLRKHIAGHVPSGKVEKLRICQLCPATFPLSRGSRQVFNDHMRVVHNECISYRKRAPAFHLCTCHLCGKIFRHKRLLTNHMKVHNTDKSFECDNCDAKFTQRRYLLRHRKEVHDKHNKSMTIIRDNISYMYRDEKNEDHPCPNCGKIFNSFKGKIGHLANCGVYGALGVDLPQVSKDSTVPNNSSVLCDVCGKEFQNNRKMKLHKKRHSQEYREKKKAENKKYRKLKVCPRCGKVVMNLQGHLLTHSDLKFQCEYCEKKCYRMDALQSHMRVHTGERPFSCYLCGQAFKQHGDMNKHILNVHKEEPIRVRPRPSQLGQEINS